MNFILEQFSFYFATVTVLFLPGWFLMQAIFKNDNFGAIEKFVISFGLSIISVDFLMILMGQANIPLTRQSILLAILLFSLACYLIAIIFKKLHLSSRKSETLDKLASLKVSIVRDLYKVKKLPTYLRLQLAKISNSLTYQTNRQADNSSKNNRPKENKTLKISHFNQNSKFKIRNSIIIILILFLTIFIKTIYLQNTIFPTATDLGHHMYWSNLISQTGELPVYEKIKIVKDASGNYSLSQPQPISDFIIGEHLIFSAINLISGIPFVSYFPTLVLFLINIMGILAIFILALRIFTDNFKSIKSFNYQVATLALLLIGPLWAISSPQAKFVSGGVIGNLLGNLFIPLCLYFYFLAFQKKSGKFLAVALFLTMGMFYTHHLSGFIFLFIVFFVTIILIAFLKINAFKKIYLHSKTKIGQLEKFRTFVATIFRKLSDYFKPFFSPSVIIFIILAICFLLFIYKPAYLTNHASGTAVGAPSKATRAGLTFTQFKYAVGEPRLLLGIIGLFLASLFSLQKKASSKSILGYSLLIGWALAISLMTLKPQWLHINLPSGRIANYANFPFVILASFAMVWIFNYVKSLTHNYLYLPSKLLLLTLFALFAFIFTSGYYDNSQSLVEKPKNQKALQTFHTADYLSKFSDEHSLVVKDHNYIKADTWMKIFLLQDYSLPFSRSYFKRYNDPTKPREMCTLWMISEPISERAQKCYNELGIRFVVINPKFDNAQFKDNDEFWKIYTGNDIAVYYRR